MRVCVCVCASRLNEGLPMNTVTFVEFNRAETNSISRRIISQIIGFVDDDRLLDGRGEVEQMEQSICTARQMGRHHRTKTY